MDRQICKTENYPEESEVFSKLDREVEIMKSIRILELQGCEMVMRLDIDRGFRSWEAAFRIRELHFMPRPEAYPENFGIYTPFKSVEELKRRRLQEKYMMMEALHTYIRWMSPSHIIPIKRAVFISEHILGDDYISNDFLMELFRLNWDNSNPLKRSAHFLFENIISLRSHRRSSYFNFELASKEISIYMDYIEEKVWPYLKKLMTKEGKKIKRDLKNYVDVTYNLLGFTEIFLEVRPSSELANALLYKLVRLLKEEKRRDLPITLLHQAVKADYLFGMKLLVQCGAEINTPDYNNNLPIHYINSRSEEYDETKNMASFLVRNGSEVDTVNYDGHSTQPFLQEIKLLKNNLEKVTLKCLAARAISKYKIRVNEDEYPENLIHIIKIHGGCIDKKRALVNRTETIRG